MNWQKIDDFRNKQTSEFLNTKLSLQRMDEGILYYKNDNMKCWVSEDTVQEYSFNLEEPVANLIYCESCKLLVDGEVVFKS